MNHRPRPSSGPVRRSLSRRVVLGLVVLLAQAMAPVMACASLADCAMTVPERPARQPAVSPCHEMAMGEAKGPSATRVDSALVPALAPALVPMQGELPCCAVAAPATPAGTHDSTVRVALAARPTASGAVAEVAPPAVEGTRVEPRARASGRALLAEQQSFLL